MHKCQKSCCFPFFPRCSRILNMLSVNISQANSNHGRVAATPNALLRMLTNSLCLNNSGSGSSESAIPDCPSPFCRPSGLVIGQNRTNRLNVNRSNPANNLNFLTFSHEYGVCSIICCTNKYTIVTTWEHHTMQKWDSVDMAVLIAGTIPHYDMFLSSVITICSGLHNWVVQCVSKLLNCG